MVQCIGRAKQQLDVCDVFFSLFFVICLGIYLITKYISPTAAEFPTHRDVLLMGEKADDPPAASHICLCPFPTDRLAGPPG